MRVKRVSWEFDSRKGRKVRVYPKNFAGQLPQVHRKAVGKMRGGMRARIVERTTRRRCPLMLELIIPLSAAWTAPSPYCGRERNGFMVLDRESAWFCVSNDWALGHQTDAQIA